MKHLDFVENLEKLGIKIFSTNSVEKIREFKIDGINEKIISKNFQLEFKEDGPFNFKSPIEILLEYAMDMDTWKHSWHTKATPENYELIEEIIQKKILKRAKEIDDLSYIYFQLHHEMAKK